MTPTTPVLPNQPRTKELEVVYAKDQPEYIPLPVVRLTDGTVISRWQLTLKERLKLLFGSSLFLRQLTFSSALQPISPSIEEPEIRFE